MNISICAKTRLKINLEIGDAARHEAKHTTHTHAHMPTHTHIYECIHIMCIIINMHSCQTLYKRIKRQNAFCNAFLLCSSQIRWPKICFSLYFQLFFSHGGL